jgi:hypothetical protein
MAGLVAAGTVALVCRMFVPRAAPFLPWLWLIPVVTAIPAAVICWRRAYRPGDVAALADSLSGGQGLLLTLFERQDSAWARSPLLARASAFELPRFRLRRTLSALLSAAAFLAVTMLIPQRVEDAAGTGAVAELMAADLKAAVVALKQQELITPEEEKRLEEEIERLRQGAEERVDASAWEASDAMRERMVASLSEKQAAVKWAQDSLARFAAAAGESGAGDSSAAAQAAELTKALEKLARSGMLAGAPPGLRGMLKDGKLPTDPAALAALAAALGKYLGETNQRFGEFAGLNPGFGQFNPAEFPLGSGSSPDGDGEPGRGGVNRGRADADLTLGEKTALFDRFKATPLPPGAPRSPDDWAPVVALPGAPQEAPVLSGPAAARQYEAGAGQEAWRRSLAPRHQSAVKKYFGPATAKKGGGQEQNRN